MAPKIGFFAAVCASVVFLSSFIYPEKEFDLPFTVESRAKRSKKKSKRAWSHAIKTNAAKHNYRLLGHVVKKAHLSGVSYTTLYKLAEENGCRPLQAAIKASKKMMALSKNIGLQRDQCLQLALFIEGEMPPKISQNKSYFSRRRTKLARTIEFDPESGHTFIHLKGHKGTPRLGKGFKKEVTQSILYDREKPELIAHCLSTVPMSEEIAAVRALEGLPGLLECRAITTRKLKHGKSSYALMCKLYKHGQLSELVRNKKIRLSLKEKLAIGTDVLRGLESMHLRGYVHRDINCRNILITDAGRARRKNGERFKAVIVDLGRTIHADGAAGLPAQGNDYYIPPEGLAFETLEGRDYYASDIYAAGCVLQRIFMAKTPAWIDADVVRDRKKSVGTRKALLRKKLSRYIKQRKAKLDEQYGTRVDIPPVEGFERVILQMIDPNARKRPTATQMRRSLERYLVIAEAENTKKKK